MEPIELAILHPRFSCGDRQHRVPLAVRNEQAQSSSYLAGAMNHRAGFPKVRKLAVAKAQLDSGWNSSPRLCQLLLVGSIRRLQS